MGTPLVRQILRLASWFSVDATHRSLVEQFPDVAGAARCPSCQVNDNWNHRGGKGKRIALPNAWQAKVVQKNVGSAWTHSPSPHTPMTCTVQHRHDTKYATLGQHGTAFSHQSSKSKVLQIPSRMVSARTLGEHFGCRRATPLPPRPGTVIKSCELRTETFSHISDLLLGMVPHMLIIFVGVASTRYPCIRDRSQAVPEPYFQRPAHGTRRQNPPAELAHRRRCSTSAARSTLLGKMRKWFPERLLASAGPALQGSGSWGAAAPGDRCA